MQTLVVKLKTAHIRIAEKDADIEKLRDSFENMQTIQRKLQTECDLQKMELGNKERAVAELTSENKSLKALMMARNETNSLLRDQMNNLTDNSFIISSEEMSRFKKIEKDNEIFQTRSKELIKSVELHMNLLQRSEQECAHLKLRLDKALSELEELKESQSKPTPLITSASTMEALKKEVVKLRKENTEFADRIDVLNAKLHGAANTSDIADFRNSASRMGSIVTSAEAHSKLEEKQQKKMIEESLRAMRSRISFLMEQMDQASQLSVAWKEQKGLLKAEIAALQRANFDLRERLLNVQRNFMDKTLYNASYRRDLGSTGVFVTSHGEIGDMDEGDGVCTSVEKIAERMLIHPDEKLQMGPANELNAIKETMAKPLPTTVEGLVERQLFDVVCGFTTGERSFASDQETSLKSDFKDQSSFKVASALLDLYIVFVSLILL
jgi:chromosome segregation ATPase